MPTVNIYSKYLHESERTKCVLITGEHGEVKVVETAVVKDIGEIPKIMQDLPETRVCKGCGNKLIIVRNV